MASGPVENLPTERKFKPHIIRRQRKAGERWHVYAYRGGPAVLTKDGQRPSDEEVMAATKEWSERRPSRAQKGRGITYHRPLFIRELMRIGADSDRWTYFIGEGRRAIKIGAAKCVESRLKILQAHNARKLRVLAVVRGGEALESAYHALFAAHRQKNEWFTPHPEIIAEIEYLNKLETRLAPHDGGN